MKFHIKRVKGYNCPAKYLFLIDMEPIVFVSSTDRITLFMQYISGFDVETKIQDKRVLKILKPYRKKYKEEKV